jgi:NAD(P)-dependent dehydrogenase (short-subunit alcohol dehydrogenase family)
MDVAGRVVVVTGGACGIGRAMCRAFAEAGARGVAIADIDKAGAERVADEVRRLSALGEADGAQGNGGPGGPGGPGGATRALALRVDVSDEEQVVELVRRVAEDLGPIDLFCANAGIIVGGGVDAPDADWERMWAVNVMSHVYAARTVLPAMIERGEGYLLHTASAAGLLTQLGSAPYSVTKHAVVALAEWLSITHAADGITVSCLCPQGVWTSMTGAPEGPPTGAADPLLSATAGRNGMLMPEDVAAAVMEALGEERFLVLPHPEVAMFEQRRADDRERWLQAMRRIQSEITPA